MAFLPHCPKVNEIFSQFHWVSASLCLPGVNRLFCDLWIASDPSLDTSIRNSHSLLDQSLINQGGILLYFTILIFWLLLPNRIIVFFPNLSSYIRDRVGLSSVLDLRPSLFS